MNEIDMRAQDEKIAELEVQIAKHDAQIAQLETALAAVEATLRPVPARLSYQQSDHRLDRMLSRSSDEMRQRMAAAVPDKLMADIVADNRRGR